MNTYIVTAKTVEEAIALANVKYADAKHEVSCEVIEMPKKGFLGIGAKEAKVKVTVADAASSDLGSIVSDMRDMKKYTDRGEQTQKKNDRRDQQKNGKPNGRGDGKNDRGEQSQKKNDHRDQQKSGKPDGNRDGRNNDRRNDAKPNDRRNDAKPNDRRNDAKPNADKKPAEVKADKQPAQRSALGNGAKPNVRRQIKHVDGEDVSGASVTVSEPVGLTDFVADAKKGSFGAGSSKSGSMSNDIRRKKPAKKFMPADKTDERMRASKYDVAESDSDYENLEIMERENEAFLEREAGAALGLKGAAPVREEHEEREEIVVPPAPPRKKEPVTQAEMDYALEFANTLLANMCINAKAVPCECPEDEEFEADGDANVYPKIEIVGEESGIIIGHHGETLDAVQYLVNLSSLRKSKSKDGDYVKIVVDTENYREKRAETLKTLARRMAAKAVKYKRNVFLEPMNAFERRIIHSELQNYPDVSTHSVGTDRDRKIIITYEGEDKPAENSRPRRRRRGGRDRKPNGEQKKVSRAPKLEPTDDLGDREDYEAYLEQKRSNKIQKVPIENLTDILDGGSFIDGGNATMTTDEE